MINAFIPRRVYGIDGISLKVHQGNPQRQLVRILDGVFDIITAADNHFFRTVRRSDFYGRNPDWQDFKGGGTVCFDN